MKTTLILLLILLALFCAYLLLLAARPGKKAMEERGVVQIPLCFLAKSLENMSLCHAAYFCKGWENARGCRIEHEAAKAYGLEIIYE